MILEVYLAGLLATAALQVIGATYATIKYAGVVPPKGMEPPKWRDVFWCAVNSALWFVFIPLALRNAARKRRRRVYYFE